MAEIKRPNYFTSQFLVEKDFNDEQAYHLGLRRRHDRVFHTPGVADGFDVTQVSPTQVRVGPGTAIDNAGREIVLEDARTGTLTTAGNDLDVFLTIAYQEAFDPADHYTQAGLDKFTRTTERPQLQDGTAAPPTDGSVILLAKIHLGSTGAIASIDTTVRTIASAKLGPKSIVTGQIADNAVTSQKLALDAQATAPLVDTRGGTNRIVAQINAGTGIIANARLEPDMMTGVVTFTNLLPNLEQFSNEIDPGLGAGPLYVSFGFEDVIAANYTMVSDPGYVRSILARADINRTTGRFSIVARRTAGNAGPLAIRWYAFKTRPGPNITVDVGVSISPPAPMGGNASQVLTATTTNAFPSAVSWSGPETGGGSLSGATPTTVTYNSPIASGKYHITATSLSDPNKFTTVEIVVTGEITVILSQTTASIFTNGTFTLTGSVINTATTGINWSIKNNAGGQLSAASGPTTTFTPPGAGTFTIVATSAADSSKTKECVVAVTAVAVTAQPAASQILSNGSTTVTATVTPNTASPNVIWSVPSGSVSPQTGPSTTFTPAANTPGQVTITAKSVTDQNKTGTCTVNVGVVSVAVNGTTSIAANSSTSVTASVSPNFASPNVTWALISGAGSVTNVGSTSLTYNAPNAATTATIRATSVSDSSKFKDIAISVSAPPPPPPPPPPPGKFISENIAGEVSLGSDEKSTPSAQSSSDSKKPRVFLTPKKRGKPDSSA